MKVSKRYKELLSLKEEKLYDISEALEKLKEFHRAKFDETVDLSVKLGLDPRKLQQPVRGSIILPSGSGKSVRVLVFAQGEYVKKAEAAGADYVGGEDLVNKIKGGFLDFDNVVATPDMMKVVAPLGKILGPRGLMPNPKTGTVTNDVEEVVTELKKGKLFFKMDKDGNIHIPVGKISFDKDKLSANVEAALGAVLAAKPASARGNYISSINLSLTMSPSVILDSVRVIQAVKETI